VQGLTAAEVRVQQPEAWEALRSGDYNCRVPGGESPADVELRASQGKDWSTPLQKVVLYGLWRVTGWKALNSVHVAIAAQYSYLEEDQLSKNKIFHGLHKQPYMHISTHCIQIASQYSTPCHSRTRLDIGLSIPISVLMTLPPPTHHHQLHLFPG